MLRDHVIALHTLKLFVGYEAGYLEMSNHGVSLSIAATAHAGQAV